MRGCLRVYPSLLCAPGCAVCGGKAENMHSCRLSKWLRNIAQTKCMETTQAVRSGASEIDMVINLGMLRAGRDDEVLSEIRSVRVASRGKILKVIVETCLLTQEEKIRICEIVSRSGADFIKTSTGFSSGGARETDILLFKKYISPHLKIKAAGGIRTLEQAQRFLALGASRIGSSAIIPAVHNQLA